MMSAARPSGDVPQIRVCQDRSSLGDWPPTSAKLAEKGQHRGRKAGSGEAAARPSARRPRGASAAGARRPRRLRLETANGQDERRSAALVCRIGRRALAVLRCPSGPVTTACHFAALFQFWTDMETGHTSNERHSILCHHGGQTGEARTLAPRTPVHGSVSGTGNSPIVRAHAQAP